MLYFSEIRFMFMYIFQSRIDISKFSKRELIRFKDCINIELDRRKRLDKLYKQNKRGL